MTPELLQLIERLAWPVVVGVAFLCLCLGACYACEAWWHAEKAIGIKMDNLATARGPDEDEGEGDDDQAATAGDDDDHDDADWWKKKS